MSRRRRNAFFAFGAVLAVGVVVALAVGPAVVVHAGVALANARAGDKADAFDRVTFDVDAPVVDVLCTDMDDAWRPLGRTGFNCMVFGAPSSWWARGAAREDPQSDLYQAWLGVYAVDLHGDDDLADVDEAGLVAFADGLLRHDQLRWLKTMGDPAPRAEVAAARRVTSTTTLFGAPHGVYEGELRTHSDRGGDTVAAKFLGRPPAGDDHDVAPFHEVVLRGVVVVHRDAAKQKLYVVYGNGVVFPHDDTIDTWPRLRERWLAAIPTVRLR